MSHIIDTLTMIAELGILVDEKASILIDYYEEDTSYVKNSEEVERLEEWRFKQYSKFEEMMDLIIELQFTPNEASKLIKRMLTYPKNFALLESEGPLHTIHEEMLNTVTQIPSEMLSFIKKRG